MAALRWWTYTIAPPTNIASDSVTADVVMVNRRSRRCRRAMRIVRSLNTAPNSCGVGSSSSSNMIHLLSEELAQPRESSMRVLLHGADRAAQLQRDIGFRQIGEVAKDDALAFPSGNVSSAFTSRIRCTTSPSSDSCATRAGSRWTSRRFRQTPSAAFDATLATQGSG